MSGADKGLIWGAVDCCLSLFRESCFPRALGTSRKEVVHARHLGMCYSEALPGCAAVFRAVEKWGVFAESLITVLGTVNIYKPTQISAMI